MKQYIEALQRVISAAERRLNVLDRQPQLVDLVDQASIRAGQMSDAVRKLERTALRKILSLVTVSEDGLIWPENCLPPRWLTDAGKADLDQASVIMQSKLEDYIERGKRILAADIEAAKNGDSDLSEEELHDLFVGIARNRPTTIQHKHQRPLGYSDLITFDMNLAGSDPLDSIRDLAAKGKFRDVRGLLRGFIATLYWTGIRPIEVWNARLLVPRPDAILSRELREEIKLRPSEAARNGRLIPIEDAARETGDDINDALRNCTGNGLAAAVLAIESAKQTNVKDELKEPVRFIVLDGMENRWLRLLAIMAQTRHLDLNDQAKGKLHRKMNYLLPVIVAHDHRYADLPLSLYGFRHSFATRVKRALWPWEAAALTGHSSPRTLEAYGQRKIRRGKGRALSPEDWLPLPDPERAESLRIAWGMEVDFDVDLRNDA